MSPAVDPHFVDVLIVGAGLSGIGSARHLQRECPERSFALLEARDALGGTWDLFRYPGIRSDSDMYTLGYSFKPWLQRKSLADGPAILKYLQETASETGVDRHIRYRHEVRSASWSTSSALWTVVARRTDSGELVELRCRFLLMCSGYYDYEQGYTPAFPGSADFKGRLFHAQHWPSDLDYRGKKVVVIGSGATAVTLVPELAREAAQTIMLQRSPTYIASVPEEYPMSLWLSRFLPGAWVYRLTRWKQVLFQIYVFRLSRRRPQLVKNYLLDQVRQELGDDYDVRTHFTPTYNPWDQRLCAVPEGDLFASIREQRAEVVTDRIERITADGIQLTSGRALEADIIVLATGLNMKFMGGAQLSVDGVAVEPSSLFVYRGMMFGNVPNLAQVFGYTNASWTLKSDLTGNYVCRLLNHMRRTGARIATPRLREGAIDAEPIFDFSSGYVLRALDKFPRQGIRWPWRLYQNYILDFLQLRLSPIRDRVLEFK
ncbi:MAG TPA: NAD(P)/FAD-dependent oxidoreductase [Halioglobus sp.]